MGQTIWYEVADLISPAAEPFMVMKVDTAVRRGTKVEGTVISLHWQREEAEAVRDRLNRVAREAVQAIRNPPSEVIDAGNRDSEGFNRAGIDSDKTLEIYQAMIDKILQ